MTTTDKLVLCLQPLGEIEVTKSRQCFEVNVVIVVEGVFRRVER